MTLRAALESAFVALSRQHGIAAACIVSAVGSLTQAMLRYADKPGASQINGPLELLMLSGTLSSDGAHLHGSVADANGEVMGGHIMPGCIVRTTAEVVIALLPGWEFRASWTRRRGTRSCRHGASNGGDRPCSSSGISACKVRAVTAVAHMTDPASHRGNGRTG